MHFLILFVLIGLAIVLAPVVFGAVWTLSILVMWLLRWLMMLTVLGLMFYIMIDLPVLLALFGGCASMVVLANLLPLKRRPQRHDDAGTLDFAYWEKINRSRSQKI